MSDTKQKPANIMYDDFVKQLYDVCNQSGLPPFLLELGLKGVYLETKAVAQQQLKKDKQAYNQSVNNNESGDDNA